MLQYTPRHTPPLALMLQDCGDPSASALAKTFGVSTRTARRWIANDDAPRAVLLSLFWVTRWGRSEVDARAVNDARLHAGMARCHEATIRRLRADIDRLLALGHFGSANDPLQRQA